MPAYLKTEPQYVVFSNFKPQHLYVIVCHLVYVQCSIDDWGYFEEPDTEAV